MKESSILEKAERIRDVIRYLKKFKNACIVIYIDDEIIESNLFPSHIHDISLIHQAGLNVIIVPGAHKRIDKILSQNNIKWTLFNGVRITPEDAMPLIKNAAFDSANTIMTSLAGQNITAVIGNWVRARGKGVLNGTDYTTAGEIDRLDVSTIRAILEDGFIPIFPCIGWSLNGKPYNISSSQLATQVAIHLAADKLFFLVPDGDITKESFKVPENIGLSNDGTIPAINIEDLESFIEMNKNSHSKILELLKLSKEACSSGVVRSHILNGNIDGSLPCEIFSDLGAGTMIYSSGYGKIRPMRREDVNGVITLMRPFVQQKILLPRTEEEMLNTYNDYAVYELDGAIRACAALHLYGREQAEIAGVAVDQSCANIGIGPKMISYLIEKAITINVESVFILTTQTADWFEKQGFKPDEVETLPEERKAKWSPERGSKVFRLQLKK